jgi:hypothetical protein
LAAVLSPAAHKLEEHLASEINVDPDGLRDYFYEVIEERLWRGGQKRERRTGIRMVRGSHGCTYVRDPDGVDTLPVGMEPPPDSRHRVS